MKYTLSISAALLLAMSQAQPSLAQNGAANLVKQAIAAEGGADALRALKGLAIKGEAKFWEPGQSKVVGGEPKLLEEATFTITWDLATGMARTEWDRDHKYPDPVLKINYIETVLPTLGCDSTRTVPCKLLTAFCTIANPMPVPSYSWRVCSRWNTRKICAW